MTDRNAVFATEFWHGANGRSLAQGFRSLGWAVEEVDERTFTPGGTHTVTRIERKLMASQHRSAFNAAIRAAVSRLKASVLVTVKGGGVTPDTLHAVRAAGVRTVNYYPDVGFGVAGFHEAALTGYDLIATTKSFHLPYLADRIGGDRVRLIHHGFSPLAHRPYHSTMLDEGAFANDILYVGNPSPYKRDWLARVAEAFLDRQIKVVGHNWVEAARGTALAPHVLDHALVGDFYAREVERSRINIGLHSGPWGPHRWEDSVSTRTFEIPACRGFMLHVDNEEVRGLFDVPGEIDVFASPDDLIAKIAHYLDHPEERRAIAQAGHARAWRDHSMDARAAEIVAAIDALPPSGPPEPHPHRR